MRRQSTFNFVLFDFKLREILVDNFANDFRPWMLLKFRIKFFLFVEFQEGIIYFFFLERQFSPHFILAFGWADVIELYFCLRRFA